MLYQKAMTARPSAVLRSDYSKFSKLCHDLHEPVLITVNGQEDLVVLSTQAYNDLVERMALTARLLEAEREIESGAPMYAAEDVFRELREMLDEKERR